MNDISLFLKELGVRVQVNSDAHYPERINMLKPKLWLL